MIGFGPWRKIPQWIAGVVFIGAVSAVLIVGGLTALSSPETAKPVQLLEPVISTLEASQRPAFQVFFVEAALIVAAVVGGLAARARPGGR